MRFLVAILAGLLRLGPIGQFLLAAAVLGGGLWLQVEDNRHQAARAAALNAGPPPVVPVEAFDPARDQGFAREVNLRVQLDFSMDYQLTLEKSGTDSLAYMVPIYPVEATDTSAPALGVLFYDGPGFAFDDVDPVEIAGQAKSFGAIGPIVVVNGATGALGEMADLVRDSFAEQDRSLAAAPIVLRPWTEGRAAALAPRPEGAMTPFDIARWIAGVFAVLGLLKLVLRPSRPAAASSAESAATVAPAPADPVEESSEPEWKRRLNARSRGEAAPLAAPTPVAPAEVAPEVEAELPEWKRRLLEKGAYAAEDAAVVSAPVTRGERLRRVALIGVGSLFALSLVLTLVTLIANAPPPTERAEDDGFSITRLLRATQIAATAPRDMADLPDSRLAALVAEEFDAATSGAWMDLDAALALGLLTEADLRTPEATIAAIEARVPRGMDGIQPDVAAALREAAGLPQPEGPARADPSSETPPAAGVAPEAEEGGKEGLRIDLQPVIDWVIDTAFLAVMGDRAAQIKIGLIVGGFIALLVGLRIYFMLRTVMSPSNRRRVHDIGSMGYN